MAADPPMTSDVQTVRELDRECEDAHDGLYAVYLRARANAVAAWDDVQVQMSDLSGTLALVMTLRAKLTAAEERAAIAERERDEARALAAERLEALRPFAADYESGWSPEVNAGEVFESCTSLNDGYTDLTVGDLRRAAALTSGADHGG